LVAYLKSSQLERPATISSLARPSSRGLGWVESTIPDGELFLENAAGKLFRLTWQPGQKDRRRGLHPGEYKVRGYRIRKKDAQGTGWHISVASAGFRKLVVRAKQDAKIDIQPTIVMNCRVRRGHHKVTVQTTVQGAADSGLTIYRRGNRIPLHYRLTNADGKAVASGPMRYG